MTRSMRADAGVVISASHNPFQDNGIKIFARDGLQAPRPSSRARSRTWCSPGRIDQRPAHGRRDRQGLPHRRRASAATSSSLKSTFPRDLTLDGSRSSSTARTAPPTRSRPRCSGELGAEVDRRSTSQPDGAEHQPRLRRRCTPSVVRRRCAAHGAHVGLALDGDADRVILVDERGAVVDGDQILAICALDACQARGLLAGGTRGRRR